MNEPQEIRRPRDHLAFWLTWFLLILLLGGVVAMVAHADNVTLSQNTTLSIVCNNQSQCITVIAGQPVFFTGTEQNTTLIVPFSFTYEPNVTVVQNITITQNVTNITIQTTNVTVTDCNYTPAVPIINVSTDAISSSLSASLTASCKTACGISDADRSAMQSALAICQQQMVNDRVSAQADINVTRLQLQQINDSCQGRVDVAETETMQYGLVLFITLLLLTVVVAYFIWHSRIPKGVNSKATAPLPRDLPKDPPRWN